MAKLGLVFSGGGGKGAYQIGVWKALEEFGLTERVSVVAGTSVGALNALLFAQRNYALAEHVWLHIRQEDIISINPEVIANFLREAPITLPQTLISKMLDFLSSQGLWSRAGLVRMIQENVDFEAIAESGITLYSACTDVSKIPLLLRPFTVISRYLLDQAVPAGQIAYFHLNRYTPPQIQKIILASSALPFIFKAEQFNGRVYYDGGLMDNIPVFPVYNEGCDLILVVQLNPNNIVPREHFPNAELITIMPQDDQGDFLSGTLDFSPEGIRRRMEQGYADAARILEPVTTIREIQRQISERLEQAQAAEEEFQQRRAELQQERRKRKKHLEEFLKPEDC